jgi:hypothetical protein
MNFKIPPPPPGTFTPAELAKILKGQQKRIKEGTQAVGD